MTGPMVSNLDTNNLVIVRDGEDALRFGDPAVPELLEAAIRAGVTLACQLAAKAAAGLDAEDPDPGEKPPGELMMLTAAVLLATETEVIAPHPARLVEQAAVKNMAGLAGAVGLWRLVAVETAATIEADPVAARDLAHGFARALEGALATLPVVFRSHNPAAGAAVAN